MRVPRARSSSTVRRGSLAISRRYALSVPESSSRLRTRRAYIKRLLAFHFYLVVFRGCGFGRTHEVGRRRLDERGRDALLPVVDPARHFLFHVLHELVDFPLHLLGLASHVQDDFDTSQIDAQISGK